MYSSGMAYDDELAGRMRKSLEKTPGYSEKKMFGGICFLLNGNMCCGVAGPDLMLRVDKDKYEQFLVQPHARKMTFTGREMKGMLFVGPHGVSTGASLGKWVRRAVAFAGARPPKTGSLPQADKSKKPASKGNPSAPAFNGFGAPTIAFLKGLEKNNSKTWFDTHREEYEQHYKTPAEQFIAAIGPDLAKLRPISYLPKVNGSLFRINRDVRFSKDKTPYKPHLDMWFWEGDKKGWGSPGFFLRITPGKLILGAGSHLFDKAHLERFRQAVVADKSGAELEKLLRGLKKTGFTLGEATRKKVPRGFDPEHPRAHLLLADGLTASTTSKHPVELKTVEFVPHCRKQFTPLAKLNDWIGRHVGDA